MTPAAIVVMGPAGSGKTTIGEKLAARLGWRFIEGDDLHPLANRVKMASGVALNDADREPWLAAVAEELAKAQESGENVVLACSALREIYRARIRVHAGVSFVFLDVRADVLRERVKNRKGHFMPASLVKSQLKTLEPPSDALTVDGSLSPETIVDRVVSRLQRPA